jgi:hypothetical protein
MKKNQIITVPFCNRAVITLAAGKARINVNSLLSERLTAIADDFELFRVTKLRFRITGCLPGTGTSQPASAINMAYYSGVVDATPNFGGLNDSPVSVMHLYAGNSTANIANGGSPMSCPTNWMSVPKQMLLGSLKWYKAIQGAASDWDEQQGTILFASSDATGTFVVAYEFEGNGQFTSPADPSTTPADKVRAAKLKEKARLLDLLSLKDEAEATAKGRLAKP